MENEFYKDEFEQLLKEKADQFSMYPSRRVWHSIYNNLHPGRRWPSVVISLFLISSLSVIGYLNTGDNPVITSKINSSVFNTVNSASDKRTGTQTISFKNQVSLYSGAKQKSAHSFDRGFDDVITGQTDFNSYTVVQSNRPTYNNPPPVSADTKPPSSPDMNASSARDIIQEIDSYINSNKIFADIALSNKKNKVNTSSKSPAENDAASSADDEKQLLSGEDKSTGISTVKPAENKSAETTLKAKLSAGSVQGKQQITNEEKAWIENYALQNKPASKSWKGRLAYQIYVTPAVNYRKLTSDSKGIVTTYIDGDINKSISQKPGLGVEAGFGLNYAIAKRLQLKAGMQFNFTNYNIAADKTNHPIMTNILLNDPSTGLSYSSARISSTANAYNSAPLQPVTLHNTTYQISVPVGFAYNLSSQNNVEWFAGATVQPSYIFGGDAHLISADLKSYVSEPSSIRPWNLNLGFETYMNFKLGGYNLQVGPQVRYQVFSTYKKEVALVEKPYAIGLKFGLTKGF
jgi:hypothetical protein